MEKTQGIKKDRRVIKTTRRIIEENVWKTEKNGIIKYEKISLNAMEVIARIAKVGLNEAVKCY